MSNIDNHPFIKEMFLFFDKNHDGLIDFNEFILGLDIVERGSFDEKCAYCFEMYDVFGTGILDIYTLRQLLKRSYSEVVVELEQIVKSMELQQTGSTIGVTWPQFEQTLLPRIRKYLPVSLDRMEFHKQLMNQLEFKYGFTLEGLEQFWNIYKA